MRTCSTFDATTDAATCSEEVLSSLRDCVSQDSSSLLACLAMPWHYPAGLVECDGCHWTMREFVPKKRHENLKKAGGYIRGDLCACPVCLLQKTLWNHYDWSDPWKDEFAMGWDPERRHQLRREFWTQPQVPQAAQGSATLPPFPSPGGLLQHWVSARRADSRGAADAWRADVVPPNPLAPAVPPHVTAHRAVQQQCDQAGVQDARPCTESSSLMQPSDRSHSAGDLVHGLGPPPVPSESEQRPEPADTAAHAGVGEAQQASGAAGNPADSSASGHGRAGSEGWASAPETARSGAARLVPDPWAAWRDPEQVAGVGCVQHPRAPAGHQPDPSQLLERSRQAVFSCVTKGSFAAAAPALFSLSHGPSPCTAQIPSERPETLFLCSGTSRAAADGSVQQQQLGLGSRRDPAPCTGTGSVGHAPDRPLHGQEHNSQSHDSGSEEKQQQEDGSAYGVPSQCTQEPWSASSSTSNGEKAELILAVLQRLQADVRQQSEQLQQLRAVQSDIAAQNVAIMQQLEKRRGE